MRGIFRPLILGYAIGALAAGAPARAQDVARPALVSVAETTLDQLVTGDYTPVIARFNEKMRAAATEDFLRQTMASLTAQLGAFKSRGAARTDERNGIRLVILPCEFERAAVDAQIAFDAQERIAGLAFRPAAAPVAAYAPPSYVHPAAFTEEDVTVDAGGWPLPGTFSVPIGAGPFPAVVLVHGSGQHDRDESIGPNKVFRDIAHGLASRGIAVLRYEKRTRQHQQRTATLQAFTVKEETIDDAVAAVALLRTRPAVTTTRIFVLGHSLGAMVAPRIARADPAIAGLVLMAAPVRSLEQSIVDQVRYLAEVDGTVTQDERAQIDMADALFATVSRLEPGDPPVQTMFMSAPASYWLDLKGFSAPEASRTLPQPMLILQGERDYQVTMDDFAAWKNVLGDGGSTGPALPPGGGPARVVEYKSYPGLNHLMMPGTGKSTGAEYMQPSHVDGTVVGDIATWVLQKN